MMSIVIDKRFCSELFEEKKVLYHKKIYRMLYDVIWPMPENFINFLKSSDTSLKITYAIKIYKDFAMLGDLYLPPFTMLNILSDQNKKLSNNSVGYVPQDHFIHSIYLYILGVYIFFNVRIFNNKLLDGNDSYYSKIKDFVLKWQTFALFHDAGYCFEDEEVFKDYAESYSQIFDELVHYTVIKDIVKAFAYKSFVEKSVGANFNSNKLLYGLQPWFDINGERILVSEMKDRLKKYDGMQCVSFISNDEELRPLLRLYSNEIYLLAISDDLGNNVAFVSRYNNFEVKELFYNSAHVDSSFIVDGIVDTTRKNYRYTYYFRNINGNRFWYDALGDELIVDGVYDQLTRAIQNSISMNNDQLLRVLLEINDWLILRLDPKLDNETLMNENQSQCIRESVIKNLLKFVKTLKIDKLDNVKNIEKFKEDIVTGISEELVDDINNYYLKIYNDRYGVRADCIEFYQTYKDRLMNCAELSAEKESLSFCKIKSKDEFVLFKKNRASLFQTRLYNRVVELLNEINIDIKDIEKYRPTFKHAFIDHGIASANLLFLVSSFNWSLFQYCNDNKVLKLAWNYSFKEQEYVNYSADCIVSMLLHNIYDKDSKDYGIDYRQNIDVNTFSYFCALNDLLQRWGRYKLIDFTHSCIPEEHFLEDDFDILVSAGKIVIRCIEKDMETLKEMVLNAESYLPGISSLVVIEQFVI